VRVTILAIFIARAHRLHLGKEASWMLLRPPSEKQRSHAIDQANQKAKGPTSGGFSSMPNPAKSGSEAGCEMLGELNEVLIFD
jgi:hypothetical protein